MGEHYTVEIKVPLPESHNAQVKQSKLDKSRQTLLTAIETINKDRTGLNQAKGRDQMSPDGLGELQLFLY